MEINWTNPAIQDLKEFKNITKMSNPNDYIINLVNNVNLLRDQPHLGKIYTYFNGYIIRQLVHEQHRIFYYEKEEIIHIVSVVHHRRDIRERIKYIQKNLNNK